jgi:hypothetical protein
MEVILATQKQDQGLYLTITSINQNDGWDLTYVYPSLLHRGSDLGHVSIINNLEG